MSEEACKALSDAVDAFLQSIPPHARYYGMSEEVELPIPAELALVRALETFPPASRADLIPIARTLDLRTTGLLMAFSLRMAILAARTNDVRVLHAGLYGLVIDEDLEDYRHVLMGLAAIEDCALRLGTDLRSVAYDAVAVASAGRRGTIDEYLAREPAFRGLGVMKIEVVATGDKLQYRPKPW